MKYVTRQRHTVQRANHIHCFSLMESILCQTYTAAEDLLPRERKLKSIGATGTPKGMVHLRANQKKEEYA